MASWPVLFCERRPRHEGEVVPVFRDVPVQAVVDAVRGLHAVLVWVLAAVVYIVLLYRFAKRRREQYGQEQGFPFGHGLGLFWL